MKFYVNAVLLCCAVLAAHARKTRINNRGETAAPGEFPYQVSITADKQHHCGGALISSRHVLTAAHCVEDHVNAGGYQSRLAVEVGSVVLGRGKSHTVKRLSYRRGFNEQSHLFLPNDIAVIHLETPVQLSATVATIALPAAYSELPAGSSVIVTGFGSSMAGGSLSYVLKELETETVSIAQCQPHHGSILQSTNICATRGPGYGTCTGDSGGPMVDDNKQTIVGIVSGGNGECGSGAPDVFTKVSHFISYIREEMNYDASKSNGLPSTNPAVDFGSRSAPTQGGSFPWPPISPWDPQPQQPSGNWNLYPQVPEQPSDDGSWKGLYPQAPGQVIVEYPQWGVQYERK